jgi:hypothetical protein
VLNVRLIFAGALLLGGAASGAEYVIGAEEGTAADPTPRDREYELKWDTGVPRWALCYYTGRDSWAANDFDVSTLKSSHVLLTRLGVYSLSAWPNGRWDGFRIALWGTKGLCIIWPESGRPKYVKPSGPKGWQWFNVNWVLPKWNYSFMAGWEQYYNYPNADAFCSDNNPTFRGHSWWRYQGTWAPWGERPGSPYINYMIRVYVETGHTFPGVEATSIGRVKALYY